MSDRRQYFRARHVSTMAGDGLIADGIVVCDGGRIVAVGPAGVVRPARIDIDVDSVLMPGLVNAHTHLELTRVPRPASPGTFQDWLLDTMPLAPRTDEAITAAVRDGVRQCLRFGVTCVGDISQHVRVVRPLLSEALLKAISYGECLGLGTRRARFDELLTAAVETTHTNYRVIAGVSPHAPYTVAREDFRRALRAAEKVGGHLTTHLAETPGENAFLDRHGGAFGELYRRLGFDPGPGTRDRSGVIALAHGTKLLRHALLAHVNDATDAQVALMGSEQSRVVWCPRTHAYFGHPPHPWRSMRAAGVTVCIGTDSCASSGDLNVVDDLRLIYRQSPDVDVTELWSMVTTVAVAAMTPPSGRMTWPIGSLAAGQEADFVAFPTRTDDPLREILESPLMLPSGVWIGGARCMPTT